jgi:hypothetical protein
LLVAFKQMSVYAQKAINFKDIKDHAKNRKSKFI